MSDLISRATLLKELRKEQRECEKDGEEFGGESILFAEAFGDVIEMVKRLSAVDAVEVVRCRECKHRSDPDECPMLCEVYYGFETERYDRTEDDGFCHRGVKMDGGDDGAAD